MKKVRTQVQLEPEEYEALQAHARRRHLSFSQAVRDAVRKALGLDGDRDERVRRFLAAAGVGREPDARRDVARRHDEVLHGRRP